MCDSAIRKAKQYAFEALRSSAQTDDYLEDSLKDISEQISRTYGLSMLDAERIIKEANVEYNKLYGVMGVARHG
jgi:hypothetical protein